MADAYTFDVAAFRAEFPQFTTPPPSDAALQAYWDTAGNFIANQGGGCLTDAQHILMLNLLTAHLAALSLLIASGQTPGTVTAATIDKVSVTLQPPPQRTQFEYWLNQTPYGQELLALLVVESVGGFYVGGSGPRAGFNQAGGIFSVFGSCC